jgi:hypothetical protein
MATSATLLDNNYELETKNDSNYFGFSGKYPHFNHHTITNVILASK